MENVINVSTKSYLFICDQVVKKATNAIGFLKVGNKIRRSCFDLQENVSDIILIEILTFLNS